MSSTGCSTTSEADVPSLSTSGAASGQTPAISSEGPRERLDMIMDEIMALMQPYRSCMRENGVGDSMPDTQASRETSSKAQATCPRNRRIEVNLGDDPESQEKGNKLLPECERLAATQK